jgi:hypothetical protein
MSVSYSTKQKTATLRGESKRKKKEMKNINRTSTGWIINTRKLKHDDRLALADIDNDTERVAFVDECVALYLTAWGIDLISNKQN